METIRISEKKIKIMLCQTDMWRYDLSVPIDITSEGGRHRLRRLLHDACSGECGDCADGGGFDPDSGELLVQIYESRTGCELFVTQCGGAREEIGTMTELTKAASRKTRITARNANVYRFRDMDSLLEFCSRILPGKRFYAESSVYTDVDGGTYYLTYDGDIEPLCAEYGGECIGSSPLTHAYLKEHASCICSGDAIEVMSSLY